MLHLTQASAFAWTQGLLAAGLLIQTVELWRTRHLYGMGQALDGPSVAPGLLLRLALTFALGALASLPPSWLTFGVHAALLANPAWLAIRSRGPVCGGSNSRWFQVQLGLTLAKLPALGSLGSKLRPTYIAAQSVVSYFLAGLSKARNPCWWNGRTLQALFTSDGPYVPLACLRPLAERLALCRGRGLAVIVLEMSVAAVLFHPAGLRWPVLAGVAAFDLFNAVAPGLNRLVWAWFATFPARLVMGSWARWT
jgi:hypothetical protein